MNSKLVKLEGYSAVRSAIFSAVSSVDTARRYASCLPYCFESEISPDVRLIVRPVDLHVISSVREETKNPSN